MNNGLGTDVWKQALDWLGDLWLVTSYRDGCWLSVRGEGHAAGNFPDLNHKDRREVGPSLHPHPSQPQPTPRDAEPGQRWLQDLVCCPPPTQLLDASSAPAMGRLWEPQIEGKILLPEWGVGGGDSIRRLRFLHLELEAWDATVWLVSLSIAFPSPTQLRSEMRAGKTVHASWWDVLRNSHLKCISGSQSQGAFYKYLALACTLQKCRHERPVWL